MSCQLCGFLYAEIGDNFFILIGIDLNISRWNFSGAIWKSQESAKYPKKISTNLNYIVIREP